MPETLIRLFDVPKLPWLPNRRGGKRLSYATVWRWASRKGPRLKTVRAGKALATRADWLMEFFEELAAATNPALADDGHDDTASAMLRISLVCVPSGRR